MKGTTCVRVGGSSSRLAWRAAGARLLPWHGAVARTGLPRRQRAAAAAGAGARWQARTPAGTPARASSTPPRLSPHLQAGRLADQVAARVLGGPAHLLRLPPPAAQLRLREAADVGVERLLPALGLPVLRDRRRKINDELLKHSRAELQRRHGGRHGRVGPAAAALVHGGAHAAQRASLQPSALARSVVHCSCRGCL